MLNLGKNRKIVGAALITLALLASPTAAYAQETGPSGLEDPFPERADFLTQDEMAIAVADADKTSFEDAASGGGVTARAGGTWCQQDSQLPHLRTSANKKAVGAKPTIVCGEAVGTLGLTATLYKQTAAGWYKIAGPKSKTNHDAKKIQITNLEYFCKKISPKRNYRVIVDGAVGYYGKPLISGSSYGDSKEKLACN